MDDTTLRLLGLDRLLDAVAGLGRSETARLQARAHRPCGTWAEAREILAAVEGLRAWLRQRHDLPVPEDVEYRAAADLLDTGRQLHGDELFRLGVYLSDLGRLAEGLPEAPWLPPETFGIGWGAVATLGRALAAALGDDGRLRDSASAELGGLRREASARRQSAKSHAESLLRAPAAREVVGEEWVTVRGDRFVLPLRSNYSGRLPGILHDRSKSGQTCFVEPDSLVSYNNAAQEARLAVAEEEARILARLNGSVREHLPEITAAHEVATALDLLQARARLAERLGGEVPEWGDAVELDLRTLRHPLLVLDRGSDSVVANDVRLDETTAALVISGANHGGKTALLQSVGLAVVMLRLGLVPPLGAGSRVGAVDGVYCQLGDHQAISSGHSSFSAQVARLAAMMEQATRGSLVLLDEVGSHTEPQAGAALAVAAIEWFLERGGLVMATTHLTPLKAFAEVMPRMANGHVVFDDALGEPTYCFLVGSPGGSETLSTAGRHGLPVSVLARTEELLGGALVDAERLWESLASREAQVRAAEIDLAQRRQAVDAEAEALRQRRRDLQQQWNVEVGDKRRQLTRLFEQTRRSLRRLERQERHDSASGTVDIVGLRRQAAAELAALTPQIDAQPVEGESAIPEAQLQPGMAVRVRSLGVEGELGRKQGGRWLVVAGGQRLRVQASELLPAGPRTATSVAVELPPVPDDLAASLNLIGLRADEARRRLLVYLDGCALGSLRQIDIIHGHGEGVLKRVVAECLRSHPAVESFHHPRPEAGGEGVTQVVLRGTSG
ncbi:MAG TPA: Smr/MutS family protein [bacterium]